VLDDGDGRLRVVVGGALGRIGVDVVVVGHLLAVELLGGGYARAPMGIERGLLVRVLAVAKDGRPVPCRTDPFREAGPVTGVDEDVAHPAGDCEVIAGRVDERLCRKSLSLFEGETSTTDGNQHRSVCRRAGHDGDARVVLGRGSHHRRPSDVDLLDALFLGGT